MASPQHHAERRATLELIGSGHFTRGDTEVVHPLVENLTGSDPFLVLADHGASVACLGQVSAAWAEEPRWTRRSILNTVRRGKCSSDRAIREYCDDVWRVAAVPVSSNEGRE